MKNRTEHKENICVRIKSGKRAKYLKRNSKESLISVRVTKENKKILDQKSSEQHVNQSQYVIHKLFSKIYDTEDSISRYNGLCRQMAELQDKVLEPYELEPALSEIIQQTVRFFSANGSRKS